MLLLIAALCLPAWAAYARPDNMQDYVRLHVIAQDDSDAAQALKLKVRDACLEHAQTLLKDCQDAEEAWTLVNQHLDAFTQAAQTAARANGFDGEVRAQTGIFEFPDRQYGDVVVPAGEYRALRIVIGSGEGQNWWCVLYPSLCMPEDYEPGSPVQFYSSLVQWIQSIFGGNEG